MPKKKKVVRKATPQANVKAGKGTFGAKAAFVRSHPDLAAKAVVDLAAKAGLKMTVNHVYNVRSTSGISRRKGESAPRVMAPVKGARSSNASAEAQFRRIVLEIGVARARTLLHDVEAKLAAILDGR